MELNVFKSVENSESSLSRLDGRVKTVFFLVGVVAAAVVTRWYLALALWLSAIFLFSTLRYSWRYLTIRLLMPFGIAWLVLLTLLFTMGSHPLGSIRLGPFHLTAYKEGLSQGILISLRVMAAVTWACALSFSTPMVEALETLRACRIPGLMIDIANLMGRYVFLINDTSHTMHEAQVSRTTGRPSWLARVRTMGEIAGNIMFTSLERSERVYEAMLARGYCDDSSDHKPPPYFTGPIPSADLRKGVLLTAFPVAMIVLCFVI
jgi:cobalt/nickel transport system permease protein